MITFGTTFFASSVAEARVTTTLALRVVFDVDVVLFVIIVGEIKKEGDDAVSMSCIFFFSSLQLLGPSLFLFVLSQRKRHLFLSLERSTRRKNRTFSGEKENKLFFSTRKRHETRPLTLSLSPSSLRIVLSHNRYRLLDRAGDRPMRRSFALFE